jgi:hypothetical protein
VGDSSQTAGEWSDRASYELPGAQPALLGALGATGTPLVAVLIGGRPATFGGARGDALLANISSLLFSFPPGQEGGMALARLILGDVAPTGRLPHAWPRHAGPSPWLAPISAKWRTHAWRRDTDNRGAARFRGAWRFGAYIDGAASPLFPFGYGLGYSRCALRQLSVAVRGASAAPAVAAVRVRMVAPTEAPRGCTEVVQCYVRDPPTRHVRRWRRLVAFERVTLHAAEQRSLRLNVTAEAMALLDDERRWRVLPGEYLIECGRSSDDPDALATTFLLG